MSFNSILTDILDFIFPRYCLLCDDRLSKTENDICFDCLNSLPKTNTHLVPDNNIEKLFWTFLPIQKATSFFFYDSMESRHIIYQLKYFNNPHVGITIAEVMSKELQETNFFDGIDVIVPIPLHWQRKLKRSYNQCDFIAVGINKCTRIPIERHAIIRKVNNSSQTHKMLSERKENVTDIFCLINPERVKDKHILLVDDVITTGSTAISCGQELMKAGNVKISVISMGYAGKNFLTSTKKI